MRSASCRETSRATKPVRLSIQHRVQRLLDRSTNHLTKMIPDPRLINLDHLSIGFSSLIGCSFILEEAVNPERSRWRASVHRQADRRVHRTTSTMASRSGSSRPGPASTRLVRHRQAMVEYRAGAAQGQSPARRLGLDLRGDRLILPFGPLESTIACF